MIEKFLALLGLIISTIALLMALVTHKTYAYNSEDARRDLVKMSQYVKAQDDARRSRAEFRAQVDSVSRLLADYHSPLQGSSEAFVSCGRRYGVDPKFLLALAWKESSLGKNTPKYHGVESYNAFGWGIHQNRTFSSWSDGICTVSQGLSENYPLGDLRATIMKYAPPTENFTELYISQIREFMSQI